MSIAGKATLDIQNAPQNLRELFDRHVEFAKTIFDRQGEIHPMWVGQDSNGVLYPMMAWISDQEDKEQTISKVREIFIKHNVVRYVAMIEAWMVTANKDENPYDVKPSERPDKEEVVWLIGEEIGHKPIAGHMKIVRDADNNGTLQDITVMDSSEDIRGLFTDVLPRP